MRLPPRRVALAPSRELSRPSVRSAPMLRSVTLRLDIPREEALRIVSTQMDPEEKARASDHVIDNSGDLAQTRAQVRALAEKLRRPAPGNR